MKIQRDRSKFGHIIHGGIGVFWRHDVLYGTPQRIAVIYIYLPWLRFRIDLTPRRRRAE